MKTPSLALIPSGYKSEKVYSVIPSNGDGDFTFTREGASGQPNSTRVNKDGLIEEVNSNMPRLDYLDGSCPTLLLENESTNLIFYSDASLGFEKTRVTISNNQGMSPDSTNNATKMLMSSSSGVHRVYERIATSLNDYNTFSVFIKEQSEISHIGLHSDTVSQPSFISWFSGLDGSIIDASGNYAKTQSLGNGWHRISISYVAGVSKSDDAQFVYFSNRAAQNPLPDFNGTETVLMYGFQAEKKFHPTSYISTYGAIKTRLSDEASNDFSSQPTVANTNTVVLKFIPMSFDNDFYDLLKFSDGTNDLRLEGFQTNNYDVYGSGLTTSGMIDGALQLDAGSINTISFSYTETSLRFSHNGSTIATNTPTGNLPTITKILHTAGASSPIKILKLEVYNDFKTQEELNSLTNSN